MTPNQKNTDPNAQQVAALTETLFVFNPWQNLSVVIPDGIMCSLDTKKLDVDFDGKGGGVNYIKRLRLVPVTTTQKPQINNATGFAVSNMFVGSFGANGQPAGLGSNMSGSRKTNVKGEWHYPIQKLSELNFTFGKYGLVGIKSLIAPDVAREERCQEIFAVVMSGITDRTLLEDLPEYFDEFGAPSMYLPDKRPARWNKIADGGELIVWNARNAVQAAAAKGIEVTVMKTNRSGVPEPVKINVKFNSVDYTNALNLIEELKYSVLGSHAAALDEENNGVLAQTREGIQNKQKKGYDALDRWLMGQFPSFAMDTELEKSNKQLIRVLENAPGSDAPDGYVPFEEYEQLLKKNEALENSQSEIMKRLEALEQK